MIILAIETSCDDTCVAIVEADKRRLQCGFTRVKFNIFSNIVSSQIEVHKKWGGVYPMLAKREHQRNLLPVLVKALKQSNLLKISNFQLPISNEIPNYKLQKPNIDLIAITVGPGLEPCLWVGVNFAKDLARKLNVPIVPVNHIEAHILVNFVGENSKFESNPSGSPLRVQRNSKFFLPAVCLVVSGGHTQLILMKNFGRYKILGETRDDAAGECFDKVARILGLGYPGGPAIAAEAAKFQVSSFKFQVKLPRPMIKQKNYDFSFSGLKTAVLYKVRSMKHEDYNPPTAQKKKKFIQEISKEVQQAIIDVLIKKTIKAAKDFKVKTIILGGGVAANQELRKQFQQRIQKEKSSFKFHVPSYKLCTDNAVMTAIAGYFGKPKDWKKIKADANIKIC